MKESLNIIVVGKSGVGKSSFLNYLIDEDHFKTGEGEPVTSEYFDYFLFTTTDNKVNYRLFDTKGIEPNTASECKRVVLGKIKESNLSDNIFQWIHSIYYCFDASAKRIQPFEINFIKELQKVASVVILLTKKDLVTELDLNKLVEQIKEAIGTTSQIISVCSVEKQTRKGSSKRSGREDVLESSFLGLWNKMSQVIPNKLVDFLDLDTKLSLPYIHCYLSEEVPLIDSLCKFPDLETIHKKNLNYDDLMHLKGFIDETSKCFYEIKKQINAFFEKSVDDIWKQNEIIHEKVFDFYRKVNRVKPHVLYLHQAKKTLYEINSYDLTKELMELDNLKSVLFLNIKDLEDCLFFKKDEKDITRDAYNKFRDKVQQIASDIKSLKMNFVNCYRAELYQYGQCCIRKDDLNKNKSFIYAVEDLNEYERIYYDVLIACLHDFKIDEKERNVLDKLRLVLSIDTYRAGAIEDLVRRLKM